jgi:ferredoxin-type protein NapH
VSARIRARPRWQRWRRATQAAVMLFYVALPAAWLFGPLPVAGTLASLHVGPVDLVEPAAGLSAALAAGTIGITLVLGMLPVIVLALVAGPVYCSWMCPWGAVSEFVDRVRVRGRDRRWRVDATRRAGRLRWIVLAAVALGGIVVGMPLVALISPPRLASSLPLEVLLLGGASVVTVTLLAALAVLEIAGPRRAWCRSLCPVGAVHTLLRTPRTLTVAVDRSTCRCAAVSACHLSCPWGIDPRSMCRFDGCTTCLACLDACPSGSLAARFGRREPPVAAR